MRHGICIYTRSTAGEPITVIERQHETWLLQAYECYYDIGALVQIFDGKEVLCTYTPRSIASPALEPH
jgi:hypothetical protein